MKPGRASAATAAKPSTRPQPVSLLGGGAPRGTAVLVMRSEARVMLSVGLTERSRAMMPETWGAAIEVPSLDP